MRLIWRGTQPYSGDVTLEPNVPKDVPDEIGARILKDYGKHGLVEQDRDKRSVDAPPNDRMKRKPAKKRRRKK